MTTDIVVPTLGESVVEAFLDGRVRWVDIPAVLCDVLDRWDGSDALSVESVLDADATGRAIAKELMSQGTPI